ncbi:MAG: methylenetetrahydrofolate reductase, partial [Gemmatimonadota bacterium]
MSARPVRSATLLDELRSDEPVLSVELRPPRRDLDAAEIMEAWIDMHHAVRRITRTGSFVFLTDNAVGESEEENLGHLTANLSGEVDFGRLVPFLTCKHPLEYCLLYAERAAANGFEALTLVGGDKKVGPARCVEHAYELRELIRDRVPELVLGGWANPHRSPERQVEYLRRDDAYADYFLTQVVSHHDAGKVEAFVEEAERTGLEAPGLFGVFYYRSANPRTLARLGEFFPVPAEELTREFDAGATPDEICLRSIRALRDAGARHIYVSNLGLRKAPRRLEALMEAAGAS